MQLQMLTGSLACSRLRGTVYSYLKTMPGSVQGLHAACIGPALQSDNLEQPFPVFQRESVGARVLMILYNHGSTCMRYIEGLLAGSGLSAATVQQVKALCTAGQA